MTGPRFSDDDGPGSPGAVLELPYDESNEADLDPASEAIVEAMGIDLPRGNLHRLLREARHAHRLALSDWLRRNDPEWRPARGRTRSMGRYDYGEDTGVGLDDWDEWWKSIWGRPHRGNRGLFRGTSKPVVPLVFIYHLCNRFWRESMGLAFHPDFTGRYGAVTDLARFADLNDAARLFLLVSQDCDPTYNSELCSRVHAVYYRRLDRSMPTGLMTPK